MLKPTSVICLFLSVSFTLASCKKNAVFNFQGTYHTNSFYEVDNPVMHTSGGTNTNIADIRQFLERRGNLDYFTLDRSTLPNTYSAFVTFFGDNKVELKDNIVTIQNEITLREKDRIIISEMDSIAYTGLYYPIGRCGVLSTQIPQLKQTPNCTSYVLPSSTGFTTISHCKYRPARPLLVSGPNLYLPYLSYMFFSAAPGTYCSNAEAGLFNTFNKTMLTNLTTGDTLIIQVKRLKMIK